MVLRRAMQQNVHVRADVHVAQLQGTCHGEDKRDVLALRELLADDLDMRCRPRGQTAGEGRIAVDVELEEVEEGVADEGDGAVDFALGAVVEFKRAAGFVAEREGDPLDFVLFVFDVFTSFTIPDQYLQNIQNVGERTSCDSCTRRGSGRRSDMKAGHLRGQR